MDITLKTSDDIDSIKWNKCINDSFNASVCAYSWYLSAVCKKWVALIKDNYEIVMPITLENDVVTTPYLTPWLGVFSKDLLSADELNSFFIKLKSIYNIRSLKLNKFNIPDNSVINFSKYQVFQYDMIIAHETRQLLYSNNIKDMLNTCDKEKLSVKPTDKHNDFCKQIIEYFGYNEPHSIIQIFTIWTHDSHDTLMLQLKNDKNEIVGGALVLGTGTSLYIPYLWYKRKYNRDYAHLKLLDGILEYYQQRNLTLYVFTNQYVPIENYILTETNAQEFEYYGYEKEPSIKNKLLNLLKM